MDTPPTKSLKTPPDPSSPIFDAPGRGGFLPERLLGRTGEDFDSTIHSSMGLEEICLENIIMASLNQDILKKNFEIIINALKIQSAKLAGVYKHFNGFDEILNEIKEGVFNNDKKLEDFKEKQGRIPEIKEDNKGFSEEIMKLKVFFLFFL